MHALILFATLIPAAPLDEALEPWASNRHPQNVVRRQVVHITAAKQDYRVKHGGTMDGTNCRSPIGGGYGIWEQSWESNRVVRLENLGTTDVVNPWLSNGRNDWRSLKEIVAVVLRPGMSDREKALALWRFQTTHRFHASATDAEMSDPVKVLNVYGYTTCGDDSICLAGLWRAAGLKVSPARCVGHCITQVFYDGAWHILDGDMGPFYLLRDNRTIASEQDLVRDHDLLRRSHPFGILDPDSRAANAWEAAKFIYEGQPQGERNSVRDTVMNIVLRPNEALVWRWGHVVPLKYHGRADINLWGPRSSEGKVWGARAEERICNGQWEYRPDFTRETWRKGVEALEGVTVDGGELAADGAKAGHVTWKMRSPYVFVGGRLEVEGTGTKFSLSWNGADWQDVGANLDRMFPTQGTARYEYLLKCDLPPGARLKRLAIVNDLQMAPLALPGMVVGDNLFTYTDQSPGPRTVRLTHEWVERSLSRPPTACSAPIFPLDGSRTNGTDIVFQWNAPRDPEGDTIADYHFELSDRADLAWPLSSNFEKLVSNTADHGKTRYSLPGAGLLTPGQMYYWRMRAKNVKGVWGPWSHTWSFTADGPAQPVDLTLEHPAGVLRWKPNPIGQKSVRYRVYGSDEKGFSVSDEAANVGSSKELSNFVAETTSNELPVVGAGANLPNANKAFYRVVALDDMGKRSGSSDYASAPRPFIYSKPAEAAKLGATYRYPLATIRSLGDRRLRTVAGKIERNFWEIEQPRFTLVRGPSWLRMNESIGLLSGVPDAAGSAEVVVSVTLERPLRRLDEGRLSWGHELVKELVTEKVGSATQQFRITVEK
jgi:hypothetical protein